MNQGYIKLYRQLLEHPYFSDSEYVHIWIYLLMSATHRPMKMRFAGGVIELQPGQLITGRESIARRTGIHPSKVQRVLRKMEIEQQIEQHPACTSRVVTILNWARYQHSEHPTEQPPNSH